MPRKNAHDDDDELIEHASTECTRSDVAQSPHSDADLIDVMRRAARVSNDPSDMALPGIGQVLGEKYRIEACIGRGGMGIVYRATHVLTQKTVALKWMLRANTDSTAQRRFLREAVAAGCIDHPNVIDVYDIGEQDGCAYLVMELLRGETLAARLRRGPLSVSDALAILIPAMRGVSAAHRAGVIHRDLKPDNIYLSTNPDGTPRGAKVLDFGIASVRSSAVEPTLTSHGMVLGTPAYMSPEQLHAASEVDARTDVYAFGVILYEMLAGCRPFDAKSYPGLVLAIAQQPPKPPTELAAGLPPALEEIVLRALAKARDDRYASVEHMLDALTAFAEADAPTSREARVSPKSSADPPMSRLGWVVASLGTLACVSVLGALWLSRSFAPQGDAQQPRWRPTTPGFVAQRYTAPASDRARSSALLDQSSSEPARDRSALARGGWPRSCEHARLAGSQEDGSQTIDPDGPGGMQAFEVYCTGMARGADSVAREYLSLDNAATSGDVERNITRFVYSGGACTCPDLSLRFHRVRLDPQTLSVDPTDITFASYDRPLSCELQHRSQCGESRALSWGGAGSCSGTGDSSGFASIDLRATTFALADALRFVPAGYGAAGEAKVSKDRKTAELSGGGRCGSMVPEQGVVALVARP